MANIKYRGVTFNNKTVFGDFILPRDFRKVKEKTVWIGIGDIYNTDWYEVDPDTICEFTGVYDANNLPIYENDEIVLLTSCLGSTSSKVIWDNYTNKFVLKYPDYTINFTPQLECRLVKE